MVGTLTETKTQTDEAFFADILAAINGEQAKQFSPEKKLPIVYRSPINLRHKLNTLTNRGISFTVTPGNFALENAQLATAEDLRFLTSHASGILCVLQQGLLTKEIFKPYPPFLDDFKTEIAEREILMSGDKDEISNEIHEQAIREVTKSWFADTFKDLL